MTRIRLVFLHDGPDAPAPTLTLDAEGRVLARGAIRPGQGAPVEAARTILVIPGVDAAAHRIELPTANPRQARAAAAVLLEDRLAVRGATHLALGAQGADGMRTVVAIDPERLRGHLDHAARLGVEPDAVAPDYALLPEPEGDVLAAVRFGGTAAVRGADRMLAVDADLLPLVAGDRPLEIVEDPSLRERVLAAGAASPAVDLLQGDFDPAAARRPVLRDFRLAAGLAAVLILSPLVLWGAEVVRNRLAAETLDNRAEALADRVAAGVRPDADPLVRVEARLSDIERGRAFASGAATLFAAVEQAPGAELMSLLYGPDGAIRATVAHSDYADVETLRAAAARSGFSLTEDATLSEGGRVLTDVVLERRP